MARTRLPSIQNVADEAGLSIGTVSRVINSQGNVSADKQRRVEAAIRKLGYKRLRSRRRSTRDAEQHPLLRTRTIGVVLLGMDQSLISLSAISSVLNGVEEMTSAMGMSLLYAKIPRLDKIPAFVESNRADGLILKSPLRGKLADHTPPELLNALKRFPCVWALGIPEDGWGDACRPNNNATGRMAADHFADKGHRTVGYLNPKPGQIFFDRRRNSFVGQAKARGCKCVVYEPKVDLNPPWPLGATEDVGEVAPLVARWWKTPKAKRPTALFVPADNIAVLVYAALRELGVRVGRDVSILGCNNQESQNAGLDPALSSIDLQLNAIGKNAVGQLLWRLAAPVESAPVEIATQPRFVERASVARLGKRT